MRYPSPTCASSHPRGIPRVARTQPFLWGASAGHVGFFSAPEPGRVVYGAAPGTCRGAAPRIRVSVVARGRARKGVAARPLWRLAQASCWGGCSMVKWAHVRRPRRHWITNRPEHENHPCLIHANKRVLTLRFRTQSTQSQGAANLRLSVISPDWPPTGWGVAAGRITRRRKATRGRHPPGLGKSLHA